MKLYTPGNPRKWLWSVLLSIRLTVNRLYYEICESAMHDSLVHPYTCYLESTLLLLLPPPSANEQHKKDCQGHFCQCRQHGDLKNLWMSIGDVIVVMVRTCLSGNYRIVSNLGRKYCRPIYSVAVFRQLSVTGRIPQNSLWMTTNILDFPKCTSVCLHHLIKTVPEMYV